MANDKKELTEAEVKALKAPVDVIAAKPFERNGEPVVKGGKLTVTKAQADSMKTRGLIE